MSGNGNSTGSTAASSDEGSPLDRHGTRIAWASGLLFLLFALVAATTGHGVLGVLRGLVTAAFFLAGAAVCLPPTRRRLATAADVDVGEQTGLDEFEA